MFPSTTTADSPIRMVYLINSLHIGGAEIGMCRLLDGLDPEKYDVTVFALSGHSEELVDQIPAWVTVVDLQLTSGPDVSGLRELWHTARQADVIVGSLFHASMLARLLRLINWGGMVATWQHSVEFESSFREFLYAKTSFLSDVVLADSEPVAEMLFNEFSLQEDSVVVVPIAGIELDTFEQVYHENKESITVGSVGRIAEYKNYSALLNVAEQLSENSIQFEVAGDGELLDEMRNEAQRRNLSKVTFHGGRTDIPTFLSTLDIYFQPSLYEGLCITVLEAMAAGLPVVGSNVGGISRNVVHNESGFLYEPNDIEGYCSGIQELAANLDLRAEFGKRSRKIVSENFTQEVLVSEFEETVRPS